MKYILLLISFVCFQFANAQFSSNVFWTEQTSMPTSEVIYYQIEKPLTWKDFKGEPSKSSVASAVTASGFGYKADMKNTGSTGQLNIGVYCYFNKNSSWVKPGKNIGNILVHEQNHFHISFIAANNFVEKLKGATINRNNYNEVIKKLYQESCALMNKMQDEYDGQTQNGQIKHAQVLWDQYILKQIATLTN